MGTAPYKIPPLWGDEGVKDIWEPPAPLAWVERHPHLFALLCAPFVIAAIAALAWWIDR